MSPDWADLPPELLHTISTKLTAHLDYIHFRTVCSNWRSSSPNTPHHLPIQLPWLMLPQSPTSHTHRRGFFSLSSNTVHFLHLPESTHRRRRRGSSHGWLLILDESPSVFLLNPLTRNKIPLPPLSAFPNVDNFTFIDVGREYTLTARNGEAYTRSLYEMRDSFVKKVILSSCPAIDTNFIAVVILNQTGEIAFYKNGDQSQSWRFIEGVLPYCEDVIYWKNLFYAVNKFGEISVCYVHGASPRVSLISPPLQIGGDMQYLVNSCSSDELLLVTRYLDSEFNEQEIDIVYRTVQFRVYSLDMSGEPKWERVTSLGDQVLFLGENSSLALRASDYSGCKANCIYFTDDYSESNYDGVRGDLDLGYDNYIGHPTWAHQLLTEHKEGAVAVWLHSLNHRNYPELRAVSDEMNREAASAEPDTSAVNNEVTTEAGDAKPDTSAVNNERPLEAGNAEAVVALQ